MQVLDVVTVSLVRSLNASPERVHIVLAFSHRIEDLLLRTRRIVPSAVNTPRESLVSTMPHTAIHSTVLFHLPVWIRHDMVIQIESVFRFHNNRRSEQLLAHNALPDLGFQGGTSSLEIIAVLNERIPIPHDFWEMWPHAII